MGDKKLDDSNALKRYRASKSAKYSPVGRSRYAHPDVVIRKQAERINELEKRLRRANRLSALKKRLDRLPGVGGKTDAAADSAVIVAHSVVKGAKAGELPEHWAAVRNVLELAGYEVLVEGVERYGSVLKDWAIRRAKKKAKLLVEASALAMKDNYVRKPGAEASLALAQAIKTMLETAGGRECLHILDNVVIGQRYGDDGELKQFSKELNMAERKAIERNPAIVNEPSTFLRMLAREVRDNAEELDLPAAAEA